MKTLIEKLNEFVVKQGKKLSTLQVHVENAALEKPFIYSSTTPNQKFHSASVGKMMTAVVIIKAIEKGLIGWDSLVYKTLGKPLLKNLFVFQGVDHALEVNVEHLLGHTSGINDYFEGKTDLKISFISQALAIPETFYTPKDLLNFTREHQQAIGAPGQKFFYSDSGYVLLGLLAEKLYGKPFFQILNEQLFSPLKMNDTTFMFYDPKFKAEELGPVMVAKKDIRLFKSLSLDFSGGGLSTTAKDLTLFALAMAKNKLITTDSYQRMATIKYQFKLGMFYGLGLMELRFEKFFFLLKGLPRLYGHLGVLGVHTWWDPKTGDTYVINVGNMDQMVSSFQILIQIVALIEQSKKKK